MIEHIHIPTPSGEVFIGTLSPDTIKSPLWGEPNHRKTIARCELDGEEISFWTESAARFWLQTHATVRL